MRFFKAAALALSLTAFVATTTVSTKSQANPALGIAFGVFIVAVITGSATHVQTNIPVGFETNLARNLRAMESSCQKSADLEQNPVYSKMWTFLRNDFYPRFYWQMVNSNNEAGKDVLAKLEALRATDTNSFDWNLMNLALATSNIVIEKQRAQEGWLKNHYYTSFINLKTWSKSERVEGLNVNECGLQNALTASSADLVAITMPAGLDEAVVAQSATNLRLMMAPVMAEMEVKGTL